MDVSSVAGTRVVDSSRSLAPRTNNNVDSAAGADARSKPAPTAGPAVVPASILADIADKARSVLNPVNLDIEFAVDKDSGNTVIRILDLETDKVIRQIPSEEMLVLSKALEKMQGALLQNKV
jgi:flagellar protein FlaG